ncbi:hypothetical protein [Metasolibacillus meyeri]|uniref:hypothetical protein n=1 Tax=Metasolibacillus meyeri TaxID=1071052 RepID=UPI000D30219E|nr:hypothetical protein [Metasolibacillus meyeri]
MNLWQYGLIFLYFYIPIYLFLFAWIQARSIPERRYGENPTILDTLAKKRYSSPILLTLIMPFVAMIVILMKINLSVLIKFFFPVLYGALLYFLLFHLSLLLVDTTQIKISFSALGYVTTTLWAFIYAHTPVLKKLYAFLLKKSRKIWNVSYFDELITNEDKKIRNSLFRYHIYLLLLFIYITVNLLDFSYIYDTEHISFITESLLTFVIIDTLVIIKKQNRRMNNHIND